MKHYLNFAVKSILHRKVRSWLTIIGIIVGIASIVALISISQGLENAIKEQFEQMGSNKFYVIPKTGAGFISLESGKITENGFIIIGNSLAHKTLKKEIFIGNKIDIGLSSFEVIGIMNSIGNEQDDNSIYIAMDDARILFDDSDGLSMIEVVVMNGFDINEVAKDTLNKLERARDAEDVDTFTPDQILQQLGVILNIVQV